MVPKYILLGAQRWLRLLRSSSAAHAAQILDADPQYADLTSGNYQDAFDWLARHELLDFSDSLDASIEDALFLEALRDGDQSWLSAGIESVPRPEFLPSPVLDAAEALGLPSEVAWELTLRLGSKVDVERRQRIGLLGELAVAKYLADRGASVDHVALSSDGNGWDLRVQIGQLQAHVEVKSTTSLARLRVFLSRNEFEVSCRDPRWVLLIALLSDEGQLLRVAHVERAILKSLVPVDASSTGRWQSCSLDFSSNWLSKGLPDSWGIDDSEAVICADPLPVWWPGCT